MATAGGARHETEEQGSAPLLRLEAVAGPMAGSTIEVAERIVFGRLTAGPGSLGEDPELSRHHAEISRGADGYVVEDLSSTNGTFVNTRRVETSVALAPGDLIDLGSTRLVVRELPGAEPPPEVDVRAATMPVPVPVPAPPAPPNAPTVETPPEPVAEPAAELAAEAPPRPPLEVRISVDVDRAEATIALEPGGAPVRFRLGEQGWQCAGTEPQ